MTFVDLETITNRAIADGIVHDRMIQNMQFVLHNDANKKGYSLQTYCNVNYSHNKKRNRYDTGHRKGWQPHEADILAYSPDRDIAWVVEVKTTDYNKGRKKAKQQLGYDVEFAKWYFGTDNVRKLYVYDRCQGECLHQDYTVERIL